MVDRNRTLKEIASYSGPDSILIINRRGKLFRIHCPFKVIAIKSVSSIKRGEMVTVTKVGTNSSLQLIYAIKGIWFSYRWFIVKDNGTNN